MPEYFKTLPARRLSALPLSALFFLLMALLFFGPAKPASAMSLDTYNLMLEYSPQFAQSVELLDKAWNKLSEALTEEQLEAFGERQQHWLNEAVDGQVMNMLTNFLDNPHNISAAAADDKGIFSISDACAHVFVERAKIVHILAAQAADEHLVVSLPGKLLLLTDANDGEEYYAFWPDQWVNALYLGTADKMAAVPGSAYKRIARIVANNPDKTYILSGRLASDSSYDLEAGLVVEGLPVGMGWRELDQWDYFGD